MNVYFRSKGRLLKVSVDTKDVGIAQVDAYLTACEHKAEPDSAVLAVIDGGRKDK